VADYRAATSDLISWDFLFDASGPVVVFTLVALAIGGRNLPLSVTR
jgi:hypothetical protein